MNDQVSRKPCTPEETVKLAAKEKKTPNNLRKITFIRVTE